MTFGKKIFELRKERGLSQEQLGEKIQVTRQTISNWELNETTPNLEQLKKISKVLNISIDELLDNDISLKKDIEKDKINKIRKLEGWEIVLLLLGAPIWLSLLITFFVVVLSIYVSLWSLVISLWAAFISLLVSAFVVLIVGLGLGVSNNYLSGMAIIGCGLVLLGITIFLFFGSRMCSRAMVFITKKTILLLKKIFKRSENSE